MIAGYLHTNVKLWGKCIYIKMCVCVVTLFALKSVTAGKGVFRLFDLVCLTSFCTVRFITESMTSSCQINCLALVHKARDTVLPDYVVP